MSAKQAQSKIQRVLTGVTTSGTPHLGNYAGAIRPAIEMSNQPDVDAFFFLADYHALIKCDDAARVERSRLEIAATWLAAGLDTDRVTFYRQSDIPEIPELSWVLTCSTPKGLMNRAHAYKASVDVNNAAGVEPDDGVTMGLYSYPILMAADILMFNAHKVPVGADQVQHLEMARDIAQRFNYHYGQGREYFVLPEAQVAEGVATLPGLDGRKMSKSYNNTIPLFEGDAHQLRQAIAQIKTDSKLPGEPKDPDSSNLFTIYKAFVDPSKAAAFAAELREGLAWGEAKKMLADELESIIAPMRERYVELMAKPERIEEILLEGAEKAGKISKPFMDEIRQAVGLRSFHAVKTVETTQEKAKSNKKASKMPRFVSFKDDSGQFMFRMLSSDGEELLRSVSFPNPQVAGQEIRSLQTAPESIQFELVDDHYQLSINQQLVALAVDENALGAEAWKAKFLNELALFSEN
ncbi:hypothetical protein AAEX37_00860 [Oligella sp. MSHR50489EDL]|uniref:tryptophan--tRNA ligase n=1 Tax=Oligella sp. MSHR50489EDL TaxID=3139409 RepID=UPI003D81A95B